MPMTVATTSGGRAPFADLGAGWRQVPERTKSALRVAILLLLVVVAYHYSLLSLAQTLGLETPLAYIGLVPILALGIAYLRSRTAPAEVAIYDRQVDFSIGVPLMAVALTITLIFPHRLSTMFWVWRIDLFSLPFFTAGATCTLFGIRALWRQRLAIAFLFLAWPAPYNVFLLPLKERVPTAKLVWHKIRLP